MSDKYKIRDNNKAYLTSSQTGPGIHVKDKGFRFNTNDLDCYL
jgi:hypothetical protein